MRFVRALPAGVNLTALMRFDVDAGIIESRLENGDVRSSKIASSSTDGEAFAQRSGDEVLGDSARGAAKGAVIGAVAGDAGKGAAAGAVGGVLLGGARRRR